MSVRFTSIALMSLSRPSARRQDVLRHQRVSAESGHLRGRRRLRQHGGLVHVRLSAGPDAGLVTDQVCGPAGGDVPPAVPRRPVQQAAARRLQEGPVLLHGRRRLGGRQVRPAGRRQGSAETTRQTLAC